MVWLFLCHRRPNKYNQICFFFGSFDTICALTIAPLFALESI